mgnify:CR=1 FL=1
MRSIFALTIILFSLSAQAQSLRSECENAYYATGYVKLHQYTVVVSCEKISDHAHLKLENIIFDNFKILSTKELESKTIYKIKELSTTDSYGYEGLLEELKSIPTRVSCSYDI